MRKIKIGKKFGGYLCMGRGFELAADLRQRRCAHMRTEHQCIGCRGETAITAKVVTAGFRGPIGGGLAEIKRLKKKITHLKRQVTKSTTSLQRDKGDIEETKKKISDLEIKLNRRRKSRKAKT